MTDKEKLEREAIIKEALTWQKTPYHCGGRIKGAGTDCGLFILQVFENVGLLPHIEIPTYPIDIAANCATPMYLNKIKEYCHEVNREPLVGDIIVYKMKGSLVPHHAALCCDKEFIIHSHVKTGVTLSNRKGFKPFEVGIYSFDGWND
ncbi:cell wall-associated NlpC family hydrolase [Sporomusaceae bacterium BoRhaA]|uniref:NlpC/P60 family protein n=1 Tax=Pelorhabdus rhamnosifermentans TaxID=2772457 RepID=UPI001C05FEF8|nr:NlpC/P60 family protein [Pelorhabdus rhamnosifermentans]MBU2701186.1 cell wall-associated NlpC family hydrolase [Pelorhabdus rhamnosifermentans]